MCRDVHPDPSPRGHASTPPKPSRSFFGFLGSRAGQALQSALDSIERYNELCEAGVDSDFGKDAHLMRAIKTPPFYGAARTYDGTSSAGLVTMAGLVTDENLNVLKADHTTPIRGLLRRR